MRRQITEYLDIELQKEMWVCRCCGHELISARENYKKKGASFTIATLMIFTRLSLTKRIRFPRTRIGCVMLSFIAPGAER